MRHFCFSIVCLCLLTSCAESPYMPKFIAGAIDVSSQPADERDLVVPAYRSSKSENFNNSRIQVVEPEDLLDADGNWNVVEQGRSMDPAKAHLAARNRVNTKRRKTMGDLTAHFEPDAKSGQDGTLRILRIETSEDDTPEFEEENVAVATSVKPVVDNIEDFGRQRRVLKGLSSFLGLNSGLPKPGRKPGSESGEILVAQKEKIQKTSIIIPPELPNFRKPPSALTEVKSDIIIPQRKPVRDQVLKAARISSKHVSQPVVKKKKEKSRVFEKGKDTNVTSRALKMRSGRHPGRTRLVLEVSDITKYKVAIDSIRNVLRIKMVSTRWAMKMQGRVGGSKLLGTYIAREQKDGSILLEVRLSEKTKILGTMILPPNGSAKHRVVIDLDD